MLEADQMKDRSFVAGKPHQRDRLVSDAVVEGDHLAHHRLARLFWNRSKSVLIPDQLLVCSFCYTFRPPIETEKLVASERVLVSNGRDRVIGR